MLYCLIRNWKREINLIYTYLTQNPKEFQMLLELKKKIKTKPSTKKDLIIIKYQEE